MKIDLSRLSEERPTNLSDSWDAGGRELNAPGIHFEAPVTLAVVARRECALAVIEATVASRLRLTCARCFTEFTTDFHNVFRLVYPLDISERMVEIGDDIREEMILNYPQKVLCRPDCLGMCPRCGVDLNKEKCKCSV